MITHVGHLVSHYGTEKQYEAALFRWRWPQGFICPACGWHGHCALNTRELFQCHRCHHQTSLTSGTLIASTKLPVGLQYSSPSPTGRNCRRAYWIRLPRATGRVKITACIEDPMVIEQILTRSSAIPRKT